jgi:hypothetical protein
MAAQLPDLIMINSEKMDLYSNPLEQYWKGKEAKRPPFYSLDSCKRGYIATWEIHDQQLFLRDVDGSVEKSTFFFGKKSVKCSMRMLFSKASKAAVKADWYSGKLRIPRGNMTLYDHAGYNSRFEKEIIITVDKGNVIKTVTLDYAQQTLVVN